jgi:hypothetical protein
MVRPRVDVWTMLACALGLSGRGAFGLTILHGLQPVGQVPNPGNYNNEIINQLLPERDLEREREEAETAHDDALRATERLADGHP